MRPIPVLLDLDGRAEQLRVLVDQRDLAAAEAEDLGPDCGRPLTRTRYLAWRAAKRAGVVSTPWPKFNEVECVQAEVAPDYQPDRPEDRVDDLDPGRPDQNAGD